MAKSSAGRDERKERREVLTLSTIAFTLMFAVWLMFGVLGIPIRKELGLTDVQFSWLAAVAILNGSLWRLPFGILADKYGGRIVFTLMLLATAVPAFLVSSAKGYPELLVYAFLVGLAGNSFTVGIAWNSAWFPREMQGFALGIFGAGNVGASVTKFIGPVLITMVPAAGLLGGLTPGGWRFVPFLYGWLLIAMAAWLWFGTPAQDRRPGATRGWGELMAPLRFLQVWRFSLYYVVMFGAYVALSVWLPKYYVDVFHIPLKYAALLTALFIFPASLLRPVGGWLSDRLGARRVMYWVFSVMILALTLLSAPNGHIVFYVPETMAPGGRLEAMRFVMGPTLFTCLVFLVGCSMGIGKAAVYKYIPEYFPKDVGAVGGLVGALGALGGFFLPPIFAWAYVRTGLPQTTFLTLLIIAGGSFLWLHLTVLKLLQKASPHLKHKFEIGHSAGR